MANLSEEEIESIAEALAPKLVSNVRKEHHDFWIDPEEHYNDHKRIHSMDDEELYEIKKLVQMFKTARGLAFKAFIGLAIIGSIAMAAVGFGVKHG